jgi:hypothetical protein
MDRLDSNRFEIANLFSEINRTTPETRQPAEAEKAQEGESITELINGFSQKLTGAQFSTSLQWILLPVLVLLQQAASWLAASDLFLRIISRSRLSWHPIDPLSFPPAW